VTARISATSAGGSRLRPCSPATRSPTRTPCGARSRPGDPSGSRRHDGLPNGEHEWRAVAARRERRSPAERRQRQAGQLVTSGVGLGRVERPTSRLSGVRSNHLSYRPAGSRKLAVPESAVNARTSHRTTNAEDRHSVARTRDAPACITARRGVGNSQSSVRRAWRDLRTLSAGAVRRPAAYSRCLVRR
jgi:hypothetical protein